MENLASQMFLNRIADLERKRLANYERNWRYYRGAHNAPLKVLPGQADDNVIINSTQYIVDKSVSFLFGKSVGFELDESGESQDQVYLDDTWRANRKDSLLQEAAVNGGVCGHCFIEIVPNGITLLGKVYPRLVLLDPAIIRPFTSPDDIEDVLWYKIEYTAMELKGEVSKKTIIERNEQKTAWTITKYEARNGGKYEQVGTPVIWGYPFPPIIGCKNLPAPNEHLGNSDVDSVVSLNDAVNFIASNMRRIIRFHAHPKTWGKGFKLKELEIAPDDMLILNNPEAMIANVEMQSDLASSRQFYQDLSFALLKTARVPHLDPAQLSIGALSGFALKILYSDLLEKTETKRRMYGDMLIELNRRLLVLAGKPERLVNLVWSTPLPENKTELTQQLDAEVNKLGTTSKQTAADELGRDWETENERKQQEAAESNNIGSVLLGAFERGETPQ